VDRQVRSSAEAKRIFEKSLERLAYTQHLWTVFEDFLDFSLLMLRWWDLKPEHFSELEKHYPDEKQHKLFAEAYMALGDIADNDGEGFKDPFGDYFMEHFSSDHKGQFFTPEHLCDMTAMMQGIQEAEEGATVCDPTCGSGRMLLSAAKLNRKCKFYAADLDLTCCKMTVINFMMNSMAGEVAWMNSLSMEHWKSWHVKLIINNGFYMPYYFETGPGETHFVERLKKAFDVETSDSEVKMGKKNQLLLF
jgi:uncharacterized protein (DUF983 family)